MGRGFVPHPVYPLATDYCGALGSFMDYSLIIILFLNLFLKIIKFVTTAN
tara:strand:- start:307 stop:456 length:150 start_codon:yes stop_codon:yes gene_type:complete